jgi:predicted porin
VKHNDIGQLDLGRQINLASNYFLPIDPFIEGFGQANIGASFGSANTVRYSNMLMLQAQATKSLTIGAGYSFATELTGIYANNGLCASGICQAINQNSQFQTNNNLRAITLGAQYSSGPLLLAIAYDQLRGPDNIPNGPPKPNPTAWLAGGAYDFKVIKISFAYGQTRNGTLNGQPVGAGTTPTGPLLDNSLGSGALFLVGAAASSMMKLIATELHQVITQAGLEAAPNSHFAQAKYLATRAATIYSGTSEVHRNILARAIGCP